ncbi:integrase family protein [Bradyrhizobium sp. 200]|uniref:tyrosine-type recombinase/integrase n=1 Tax=Bradyrhizobium sp. 200 TaxID=2782665 RepID=UPI001FFE2F85|nr:integrase family protein [Bradyrhizobium sp. 200]UPJ49907.1 integrase family protein [Bradyrhizobium sp. 200]
MSAAVKLTDAKVKAAKPASARREVRDALAPGLRLIIQSSGFKSWAFRYVVGGRDRRMALGDFPAVSLDAARQAANAARAAVLEGRDPAADKATARAPANSVLAAFKAYDRGHLSWGRDYIDHETVDHEKPDVTPAVKDKDGNVVEPAIGEETAKGNRSFFVRRVLPVWGLRPVSSITRQDVVALLDKLKAFKDARRKGRTRLTHFFKWTMDRNALVTVNPAAGIEAEGSKSRERVLSDDELRAVWLACGQLGNFGALVRTLILTMSRRNEAARMDRAELSKTLWSVEGDRTKNGLPMDWHRTAQLNAIIDPLLKASNSPFVFEGRHHNRPLGGFSDLKAQLDELTGDAVAPWTLHDLRRTSRSIMQGLKIPLEVRRACSNHVSGGVDGVYDRHAYAAEKVMAFEALAREIDRIVAGKEASNVVPMTRPMAESLTIA